MILIIDCGSQFTQNIARRIRQLGVYAEIISANVGATLDGVEGIIISGGPQSIYDAGAPKISFSLLGHVPILGICYGMQLLASMLGGNVYRTAKREYGNASVAQSNYSVLFQNMADAFDVWMSHGDIIDLPPECEITLISHSSHIAGFECPEKKIYGVQFHPEVDHTEDGTTILKNFLAICQAKRDWSQDTIHDVVCDNLRLRTHGRVGVGGVSGGVDSTTAAYFLSQISPQDFHPIFIDNGLMREGEVEEIRQRFDRLEMCVTYIDAADEFLAELEGITSPDDKRRVIGETFIRVFEREADKIPNVSYLLQGTLYPDVIESTGIKRHHNVGGLPENMNLDLVEPFRFLFKDEVRDLAIHFTPLTWEDIFRHPFPGPGLAVRMAGEVTREKLAILRHVDYIYIDELRRRNLYHQISQAAAILTSYGSIGVMGDGHSYERVVALRAVTTKDFMTADWYDFEKKDLQEISTRIVNEVEGVNRVVYDITQKPPATIEWY